MSNTLKRTWISPSHEGDLFSLTLESAIVQPDHRRLQVEQNTYPDCSTRELRHVVVLRYLTDEDLWNLQKMIHDYVTGVPKP